MSASPLVLSSREEWLQARRSGVGASEVAAILGVDPRRGPLAVYAAKVGEPETAEERAWMRRGRRLEAVIADEYAEETGRTVTSHGEFTLTPHGKLPFFFSTLDRTVTGDDAPGNGPGPLEAKAVWAGKTDLWDTEPPIEFQVQLQAQMACTGAEWGVLVALIGGLKLWHQDVPRNDRFIATMTTAIEQFWERVERRRPPDPDATEGTRAALRALYPKDKGTTVDLPAEFLPIANRIDELRESIDALKDQKDIEESRIKLAIGEHTFGKLPDGSQMKWAVQSRKGYVVDPCEFRKLTRVSRPKAGEEKR